MTTKAQTTKSTKAAATKTAAKRTNSRKVGVNISVPADLHRRFRIAAINRDLSLADAIIEAMDKWTGRR